METLNPKIGWTVNKQYGYVSEIEWSPREDNHIEIQHFKTLKGVRCAPELICTEYHDEEPYENNDAWVFTDESKMHDWMREEASVITSKLQHYLERLSTIDAKAGFITNSVWPPNFVLGHLPNDYKNYTRVHTSRRKISEYSVQSVIEHAESQLGMPVSMFTRVWNKMEYGRYNNELSVTLAVDRNEHKEYFKQHALSEDKVRSAIEYVMKNRCPSLRYNLNIYRTPRYLFGDDKHLVDTTDENFDNVFFRVLGNNLKTKLSSATRNKDVPKTNICAYLVSNDMLDKIPAHIMNWSVVLPYSFITHKCYAVYAPININVWSRPDNTIIVDTLLSAGTASLTQFNDSISSTNILDQLLEMSS